jgi:hypothetical protein
MLWSNFGWPGEVNTPNGILKNYILPLFNKKYVFYNSKNSKQGCNGGIAYSLGSEQST